MSWAECEPLVAGYSGAQAGIAPTAGEAIAGWKAELTAAAAAVTPGIPTTPTWSPPNGKPALKRRTGTERRASALALESAVHDKLPERGLLEILARTACQIGWTRHFGPALGSDPKLPDALGRDMTTAFCYGPGRDRCPRERRTPGPGTAGQRHTCTESVAGSLLPAHYCGERALIAEGKGSRGSGDHPPVPGINGSPPRRPAPVTSTAIVRQAPVCSVDCFPRRCTRRTSACFPVICGSRSCSTSRTPAAVPAATWRGPPEIRRPAGALRPGAGCASRRAAPPLPPMG